MLQTICYFKPFDISNHLPQTIVILLKTPEQNNFVLLPETLGISNVILVDCSQTCSIFLVFCMHLRCFSYYAFMRVLRVTLQLFSGPRLTLLLASWLSWQDLAKFLLHLGNHGSHGKILIKILLR